MNGRTGSRGTYVMAWSQTVIDRAPNAPISALRVGADWSWHGEAFRIDGANTVLTLSDPIGGKALRQRAGRIASRFLRMAQASANDSAFPDIETEAVKTHFTLSDGQTTYGATILQGAQLDGPLVVFTDRLPPANAHLVVQSAPNRIRSGTPGTGDVICFANGTALSTSRGPVPVEDLRIGDRLRTRDNGFQPLLWIGRRTISGARLHVMPALRPVRIPSGAFGPEDPRGDLLVSPQHRLLVRGQAARALFNEDEALVAATDLLGHRRIHVDRHVTQLTYFHLMLPRHEIVWANGVACDSFHPAHSSLSGMPPEQRAQLKAVRPDILSDPSIYGREARRMLSSAEARILLHNGSGRKALRHTV